MIFQCLKNNKIAQQLMLGQSRSWSKHIQTSSLETAPNFKYSNEISASAVVAAARPPTSTPLHRSGTALFRTFSFVAEDGMVRLLRSDFPAGSPLERTTLTLDGCEVPVNGGNVDDGAAGMEAGSEVLVVKARASRPALLIPAPGSSSPDLGRARSEEQLRRLSPLLMPSCC